MVLSVFLPVDIILSDSLPFFFRFKSGDIFFPSLAAPPDPAVSFAFLAFSYMLSKNKKKNYV